jgi:hypothetical protein
MDYFQDILSDDLKVRAIVSDVSCEFESELHDGAWMSLYQLAEINAEGRTDMIGSDALREALRLGALIQAKVRTQAAIDAALAEDAAIEEANEMRSEQRAAAKESRAAA